MQKKLETFLLAVDADFSKKVVFTAALVEKEAVIRPLYFNMGG